MNPPASTSVAQEVNRLHEEVVRQTDDSKKCLHAALAAAWQAGRLLLAEQDRVRRMMGGAWLLWLEQNFRGAERTAQNYMRLADSVPDVSAFQGLSLRQVYLRLGIATEPKSRVNSPHVEKLPPHVRLANKLLVVLSICDKTPQAHPEQRAAFQQDLRALYERLRRIFETGPVNLTSSPLSKRNQP
jgi:hypothetical protein